MWPSSPSPKVLHSIGKASLRHSLFGGRSCPVTSTSRGASQADGMGSPYFLSFRCALQRLHSHLGLQARTVGSCSAQGQQQEGIEGSVFQLLNGERENSYKSMWIGATHLYTHTCTHTHSHTLAYIYTLTHIFACIHTVTHTYTYTCTHAHSHTCTPTCTHSHTCRCTHMHAHTHSHACKSLHVCMHSTCTVCTFACTVCNL